MVKGRNWVDVVQVLWSETRRNSVSLKKTKVQRAIPKHWIVEGGRNTYGKALGIMVLDTRFDRLPGDVANASTYSYPVVFKTIKGATAQKVIEEGGAGLVPLFARAAKDLEREGVRAITTSCGFLALHQKELAASIKIPLFTSSLIQIPIVHAMLGGKSKVGVLTANAASLTDKHLRAVGIQQDVPLVIVGLEKKHHLARWLWGSRHPLDAGKVEQEVIESAQEIVRRDKNVKALVLECTNLPPFSHSVQEATRLPVFDIITLADMIYHGVTRHRFGGFL